MRILIIDGYNAINKIPELRTRRDSSLEASRGALLEILKRFLNRKAVFHKAIAVFDSKERRLGVTMESYGKVDAVFANADKDADQVIVDILRNSAASDIITVASDDNFVRNHARVFGRDLMSIADLKSIIMLKNKTRRSKIREKELEYRDLNEINRELKNHWGIE